MQRITKPLLIFFAAAAVLMACFQGMNTFTNFKALPITSELMEPAVFRGSLMFMEKTPEKDVKSGDIIAVSIPNQQNNFVGRLIQSKETADGYYNLTFKGDNRTLPESFPYTVKDATYVNKASIPLIGYLIALLSTPVGLILFAGAAIYFAWYYLFKMHDRLSWSERSQKRRSYRNQLLLERAEARKNYSPLHEFFDSDEENDNHDYTGSENNEHSEVEEQTR